jgi:hypothetical protein
MAPITLLRFFAATGLFAVLIANISAVQDRAPFQSDNHPPSATEVVVREGRLSIRAENESLVALLRAVARHSSLSITVAPELDAAQVSISFADFPIDEGLRRIVHAYDAFFYYAGATSSPVLQGLWVFPRGQGGALAPLNAMAWASDVDVEKRLVDPDPSTRFRALKAHIERRGEAAMAEVLTALADPDEVVRAQVLDLAFGSGLRIASDRWSALALSDPSALIRLQVLQAAPDGPELASVAETAQNDPDPYVQMEARAILARVAAAAAGSANGQRVPRR